MNTTISLCLHQPAIALQKLHFHQGIIPSSNRLITFTLPCAVDGIFICSTPCWTKLCWCFGKSSSILQIIHVPNENEFPLNVQLFVVPHAVHSLSVCVHVLGVLEPVDCHWSLGPQKVSRIEANRGS